MYQTTVKEFIRDESGKVCKAILVSLTSQKDPETGRTLMVPVEGSEKEVAADLVLIAAGFLGTQAYVADAFGVELNERTNVATDPNSYATNVENIFAAGDMHRGQSLVVWAIRDQMCLLSGSIAYFINTLRSYRIRPFILLLITAFYALIPYHAVFAVTIWKDIPFAAAVLLLSCTILRLTYQDRIRFREMTVFILSGIMICLFRSNGWYAFLLSLPFLLFVYRRRAKVLYPALLAILCTAVIVKYPVMKAYHVEQPDFIESVCIPMQQITAVICNDRELTDRQRNLVENVVDLTYIKDLYNPIFADNIKELVRAGNQDYLVEHKGDFLKLWIELGLRYPGDYLTAYVRQTYGYWYPDSFYLVAEAEGVSATKYGVSHTPLIGGPLVIKGKEIAIKLGSMVPIYGTLWSMGVACWIMIFSVGTIIIRREYRKLTCFLPSAALLFTVLIATPVATEFRYVYFMVCSLPFYLITAMLPDSQYPNTTQQQLSE